MAGLLAIGFLRMFAHNNLALENAAGVFIHHAFEHFAAGAMRNLVVHHQARVGVLFAVQQISACDERICTLASEKIISVLPIESRARRESELIQLGAFGQCAIYE